MTWVEFVWCPYASISAGAIGTGYATTLDELAAHRRGRRVVYWYDFIVNLEVSSLVLSYEPVNQMC